MVANLLDCKVDVNLIENDKNILDVVFTTNYKSHSHGAQNSIIYELFQYPLTNDIVLGSVKYIDKYPTIAYLYYIRNYITIEKLFDVVCIANHPQTLQSLINCDRDFLKTKINCKYPIQIVYEAYKINDNPIILRELIRNMALLDESTLKKIFSDSKMPSGELLIDVLINSWASQNILCNNDIFEYKNTIKKIHESLVNLINK